MQEVNNRQRVLFVIKHLAVSPRVPRRRHPVALWARLFLQNLLSHCYPSPPPPARAFARTPEPTRLLECPRQIGGPRNAGPKLTWQSSPFLASAARRRVTSSWLSLALNSDILAGLTWQVWRRGGR